jgi:hypothetical protein
MKPLHLILALAASVATASATPSQKAPASAKTAVPAVTNAPVVIPQSVFVVPQNPREGRNPFFPNSTTGQETVKPKAAVSVTAFVLNGITSPPRRTAMINGRTFEAGETGEIKLADGTKAKITCEEIRDTSAMISVNGERRELHLRANLR